MANVNLILSKLEEISNLTRAEMALVDQLSVKVLPDKVVNQSERLKGAFINPVTSANGLPQYLNIRFTAINECIEEIKSTWNSNINVIPDRVSALETKLNTLLNGVNEEYNTLLKIENKIKENASNITKEAQERATAIINLVNGASSDYDTLKELENKIKQEVSNRESAITTEVSNRNQAIQEAIDNLINGAGDALNTLDELAQALGDDPNFATTVATNISNAKSEANAYTDDKIEEVNESISEETTARNQAIQAETTARNEAIATAKSQVKSELINGATNYNTFKKVEDKINEIVGNITESGDTTLGLAKTYTDQKIDAEELARNEAITTAINNFKEQIVGDAPEALDTFEELLNLIGTDTTLTTSILQQISSKQDKLVNKTNIKSVNGTTLLGSGDLEVVKNGDIDTTSEIGGTINKIRIDGKVYNILPTTNNEFIGKWKLNTDIEGDIDIKMNVSFISNGETFNAIEYKGNHAIFYRPNGTTVEFWNQLTDLDKDYEIIDIYDTSNLGLNQEHLENFLNYSATKITNVNDNTGHLYMHNMYFKAPLSSLSANNGYKHIFLNTISSQATPYGSFYAATKQMDYINCSGFLTNNVTDDSISHIILGITHTSSTYDESRIDLSTNEKLIAYSTAEAFNGSIQGTIFNDDVVEIDVDLVQNITQNINEGSISNIITMESPRSLTSEELNSINVDKQANVIYTKINNIPRYYYLLEVSDNKLIFVQPNTYLGDNNEVLMGVLEFNYSTGAIIRQGSNDTLIASKSYVDSKVGNAKSNSVLVIELDQPETNDDGYLQFNLTQEQANKGNNDGEYILVLSISNGENKTKYFFHYKKLCYVGQDMEQEEKWHIYDAYKSIFTYNSTGLIVDISTAVNYISNLMFNEYILSLYKQDPSMPDDFTVNDLTTTNINPFVALFSMIIEMFFYYIPGASGSATKLTDIVHITDEENSIIGYVQGSIDLISVSEDTINSNIASNTEIEALFN